MTPSRPGQSVIEYSLVIAVAIAAAVGMNTFGKRGIQGVVKGMADEIGQLAEKQNATKGAPANTYGQWDGMLQEARDREQKIGGRIPSGTLLAREDSTRSVSAKEQKVSEKAGVVKRTTAPLKDTVTTTATLTKRGAGVSSYQQTIARQKY